MKTSVLACLAGLQSALLSSSSLPLSKKVLSSLRLGRCSVCHPFDLHRELHISPQRRLRLRCCCSDFQRILLSYQNPGPDRNAWGQVVLVTSGRNHSRPFEPSAIYRPPDLRQTPRSFSCAFPAYRARSLDGVHPRSDAWVLKSASRSASSHQQIDLHSTFSQHRAGWQPGWGIWCNQPSFQELHSRWSEICIQTNLLSPHISQASPLS